MPNPVDIYVGQKLRMRRKMLGLSQNQLGKKIGVTFQQIQKYEKGINRMGSSRLHEIATILLLPISYFFDGYDENPIEEDKQLIKLCKHFLKIKEKGLQDSVINLAKSLEGKGE